MNTFKLLVVALLEPFVKEILGGYVSNFFLSFHFLFPITF